MITLHSIGDDRLNLNSLHSLNVLLIMKSAYLKIAE